MREIVLGMFKISTMQRCLKHIISRYRIAALWAAPGEFSLYGKTMSTTFRHSAGFIVD